MEPPSNVVTRPFQSTDLSEIVRINRQCLPENYPESFFLYVYSSFPAGFRIADVDGKIVAYLMSRIETGTSAFSKFRRVKKGHVISVAVLPQYQRRGIAERILIEVFEKMIAAGANEVFLEVRVSNYPAVALYEKLLLEKSKILKNYYCDNESAYMMARKFS
ncbi:MAG: GNAT family N-acetyltransferase [Candidatus Hodarchaeales archaeon]|jgi:ribosomal-protein-alanine N-acetyltransferase